MTKFWIAVACQEHVQRGVDQQIVQVCHGKLGPLKRMKENDGILYYSPTIQFQGKEKCQCFTAIGTVRAGDPYLFKMSENFVPWRRKVDFMPSFCLPIAPLIDQLSFIVNKQRWGYPFRRGFFEISKEDFDLIKKAIPKT